MVFVNDKKYACETCIKGHRSSACTHTDRPLFEIKKKGRPVTQCEHCRELRKTKQVHVKCLCEHRDESEGQEVSHSIPAKKGMQRRRHVYLIRFVLTSYTLAANRKGTVVNAAFPEGLKDAPDVTISLGGPQQAEKAAQRSSRPLTVSHTVDGWSNTALC
ncbi:copper-fist-domain-containing protein [Rickenella mellea]|uniref:Copper-fist-domain-containing protein n=1 Tax=Rickenella mellea TaxID=50990 RepID=A0A4Y7PZT5_9AGAM|nr:copper-fist-domain-containing protein [Rickenella mellea]